jgi:hypothetical protein
MFEGITIAGAIVTAIAAILSLFLQYQGNQYQVKANEHYATQNRILAAQGGSPMPPELPTYKPPKWPFVFIAMAVVLIWAAIGSDYLYFRSGFTDMSSADEKVFIDALSNSKNPSPGRHFHIFCVDAASCSVAKAYRDRLYRGGWKDLPDVDLIAGDGISILTYTENAEMPPQVSDLARAFAATSVNPAWSNGSGKSGTTVGSTGPSDDQIQTRAIPPPVLLKTPQDFALVIGPRK